MNGNNFENNVYDAENITNTPSYPEYTQNSVNDPTLDRYQAAEVEEVNSGQAFVVASAETQHLSPLRRVFILEPPIFLLNFSTALACRFFGIVAL